MHGTSADVPRHAYMYTVHLGAVYQYRQALARVGVGAPAGRSLLLCADGRHGHQHGQMYMAGILAEADDTCTIIYSTLYIYTALATLR